MSIDAIAWVLEHSASEHSERLVAIAVASHAGRDGRDSYPSIATLARETRLGESTVRKALDSLKARGELIEDGVSTFRTRLFHVVMGARDVPERNVAKRPKQAGRIPAGSAPPQDLHPRRICTPAGLSARGCRI